MNVNTSKKQDLSPQRDPTTFDESRLCKRINNLRMTVRLAK